VVAIPVDDDVRTRPLGIARLRAVLLRRGLLSFAALLFLMLPSGDVNEGRDRADDTRQQCGRLTLDFSDPCNAIARQLFGF
jgi:hypothetical protein